MKLKQNQVKRKRKKFNKRKKILKFLKCFNLKAEYRLYKLQKKNIYKYNKINDYIL